MNCKKENSHQDIAIIGMSARFPGAKDVQSFWENLVNGVESISTFTEEELRESGIDEELIASPNYIPRRGILGDALEFDAQFFDFTPRDAEILDPQHRVFLECCWHAFEDAGYVPNDYPGNVGVFGGTGTAWHLNKVQSHPDVRQYASGTSVVTNNDKDYVTTRVSYKLNLKGPSANVQTACSTAMVATVLGMRSLQCGESDLIVAGGVSIDTPERRGYEYMQGGMESADGRCYAFDSRANGTVFSRGAGVVILKRLDDAIADRDHIYAVIKGAAINNDGELKAGFTAPSIAGQISVANRAIDQSGINPSQINFIEAHGTATALGDPIEFSSLTQTFQKYTDNKQYCLLGSVKTNIGHTDAASAMASLIKSSLSIKHKHLPASLNYQSPNPNIDFEHSPFKMNTEYSELGTNGEPIRGLVNSFGVGGTNACVIIEQAPLQEQSDATDGAMIFPFSTKTSAALEQMKERMKAFIESDDSLNLADVAYTLQIGRKRFNNNSFIVAKGRDDLLKKLESTQLIKSNFKDQPHLVFMFPGQGNQYINMAKPLYDCYPVFREIFDQCCELLKPILGRDIKEIIFQDENSDELARINETQFTQPALYIVEYSLARLWMSWGIEPSVMVGHSVGEYVAACLSGVFSLEDALRAVALRGKLVQQLPAGSMLAVLLDEEKANKWTEGTRIEIAAMNYPGLCVLAGELDEIAQLQDKLEDEGIFCKHLDTSHAFHSYMMEPALDEFRKVVQKISLHSPNIPFVSTVTGDWMTEDLATSPEYWVQHVRRPVKFSHAFKTLLAAEEDMVFLEVGPGRSLESAAKQHMQPNDHQAIFSSVPIVKEKANTVEHFLTAMGSLWANGINVPWQKMHDGEARNRLSLPGYPFQHKEFKLPVAKSTDAGSDLGSVKELKRKKNDVGDWFYIPSWKRVGSAQLHKGIHSGESTWLVFADERDISKEVKAQILRREEPVIWVTSGEQFEASSDGFSYVVRADVRDDYKQLFKSLKDQEIAVNRIVHLWNIADLGQALLKSEQSYEAQKAPFYGPLYIAQALVETNQLDDTYLVFACNNTFSVAGEPIYSPQSALLTGIGRVFYHEYAEIQAHVVDLDLSKGYSVRAAASQLIAETLIPSDGNLIAYRGDRRWEESYEPVYLDKGESDVPDLVRDDGVYLITGGLGGLGILVAKYLSGISNCTLILTYRSSLPERSEWNNWLQTHPVDDEISEKLAGVLRLEESGNKVYLIQADICNRNAMQDALAPFGQIHGVFHTAGVAGGGIIPLKQDGDSDAVINPKVAGSLILDELLDEQSLDFFILFSSITSIVGDEARIDYCAGNAFMDAFAAYRNQRRPGRTVSVNWGKWGDIGMAIRWAKQLVDSQKNITDRFEEQTGDLLTLVNRQRNEEEYRVNLAPNQDWVIDEHRLQDQPTLVGTTILSMLNELTSHFKVNELLQVKSLMLTQPVIFQHGWPRTMSLFVTHEGQDYRYSLRSRGIAELDWAEHAFGVIAGIEELDVVDASMDLSAIKGRCQTQLQDVALDNNLRGGDNAGFLSLSNRWDNHKAMWEGDNEWLLEKSLLEEYREDMKRYPFHPALVDSTAISCINRLSSENFLPISYGKISFVAPLEAECWAHVSLKQPYRPEDSTMVMNIVFYSSQGEVLMTQENYTLIKVDPNKQMDPALTTPSSARKEVKVNVADKDILYPEGVSAVHRLLSHLDFEQVVVVTSDLAQLIWEAIPARDLPLLDDADESASDSHSRPELSVEYVAPSNDIEKEIAKIWQSTLGISGIGINDSFTELGGNSLLAVQVISAVSEAFEIDIRVDLFYKDQTISGLANLILSELEDVLEVE
ncbi:MAG: hypothetical protein CENE_00947 [Candidatus Celerinatantimonas neptuna]|nr:MAG: hypothetical protein CENE_00947 [Candidatus Celerinatantimonas neptuna]